MKIRCLVIDDNPHAVDLLSTYIRDISFLELKAATTDAIKGLDLIKAGEIDLVFLDIQMPGLNGLQLIKLIEKHIKVILTTAYSEHALDGYELNVVDYLLKPIGFDRFYHASEKALDSFNKVASRLEYGQITKKFLFVKTEHRIQKIDLEDIVLVEGLENYVSIITKNEKILSLQTMKKMEEQLPPSHFARVHRSYIVSLGQISHIEKSTVLMSNGTSVPIGSSYRNGFLDLL